MGKTGGIKEIGNLEKSSVQELVLCNVYFNKRML